MPLQSNVAYSQIPSHDEGPRDARYQHNALIHAKSVAPTSRSHPRQIRLVGRPLSERIPSPTASLLSSSLVCDHSEENDAMGDLVDVLDASSEDPFTLETLGSLIHLHAAEGKDFIIARVTTADPIDDGILATRHTDKVAKSPKNNENDSAPRRRLYYSYYAAHHINKVLFRTQPSLGLLHRMKAKNPLNNMTIEGDVHYFVIKAESVHLAQSPLSRPSPVANESKMEWIPKNGVIRLSLDSTRSFGAWSDGAYRERELVRQFQALAPPRWTQKALQKLKEIIGVRKPGDENEHGIARPPVRLRLIMRPDVWADGVQSVAPLNLPFDIIQTDNNGKESGFLMPIYPGSVPRPPLSPPSLKLNMPPATSDPRRKSFDDAHRDVLLDWMPNAVRTRKLQGTSTVEQWISQLQRFAFGFAPTPFHKPIRSYSYMNDLNAKDGEVSREDWFPMSDLPRQSPRSSLTDPSPPYGKARSSSPTRRSPRLQSMTSSHTSHTRPRSLSPARRRHGTTLPSPHYTAHFYATDDDFLMKASVRAYFRLHSLEASDAVLFTLPTIESSALADGHEARVGTQHPTLLNFTYTLFEEYEEDGERRKRLNMKWVILSYLLTGLLLLKFVVPESLLYMGLFFLVFILCLGLILFF